MDGKTEILSHTIFEGSVPAAPQLSVLIPTYRRGKYLFDALSSVFDQNPNDVIYEVIVLNNDPEADMNEMIEHFKEKPIRFLRNQENLGMVGNHNRLADLARGEYIAFLHDDDLLLPNYLETFSRLKDKGSECLITSRFTLYSSGVPGYNAQVFKKILGRILFFRYFYRKKHAKIDIIDAVHVNDNVFGSPSCGTLLKRKVFMDIGKFDDSVPFAWDMEFFLRLAGKYSIEICRTPTGVYRMEINASARPEVLFDFYKHQISFQNEMIEKDICRRYLKRQGERHLFTIYAQLGDETRNMAVSQGLIIPKMGNRLLYLFSRIESQLYRLLHNLDFQDPVDEPHYKRIRERIKKI